MQQSKSEIALTGNSSFDVDNWIARLMISANEVADQIMIDSAVDNALRANYAAFDGTFGVPIPQAELMSSHYGSFGQKVTGMSPRTSQCLPYSYTNRPKTQPLQRHEGPIPGATQMENSLYNNFNSDESIHAPPKTPSSEQLLVSWFLVGIRTEWKYLICTEWNYLIIHRHRRRFRRIRKNSKHQGRRPTI